MGKKLESIWEIDPHTKIKHLILKTYWQAWLPIMTSWSSRVLYIDGFAGPGVYKSGEEGSPVIVLKSARDHIKRVNAELIFVFVEKDDERFDHLQNLLKQIKSTLPANFKIYTIKGAFDEEIGSRLDSLEKDHRQLAPCFAFIDPFGFSDTPFEIVRRLMSNPQCEVFITFMFEEINRFKSSPNLKIGAHLDRLFGTTQWRDVLKIDDAEEQRRAIHDIYLAQLRSTAKYVRSFKMVNRNNNTDYFLFFASNNIKGLEKMKEAMWKADPQGEFSFSDYTESLGLMSLFGNEPDYELLKSQLLRKFVGLEIPIEAVRDFVIGETAFLASHFKAQILKPMEEAGELSAQRKDGKSRRKGTFPDGTWLKFEKTS